MRNYSPRQKTFTPPSVQSSSITNNTTPVMQSRQKIEFYSGARFDTFLPSASALPMPPVQWIDPNATQRSQSTPSSPIPKNSISATKSIDIAAVFCSVPSNVREQQKMTGKTTTNNVNGNKHVLKSNSYPGEKTIHQQQQQQNKKVVKLNNDYKGQKPRNNQQNNRKQQQQKEKPKPTAATTKTTLISTAATSVNSTTTTNSTTTPKPEIPAKTTVTSTPVSGKDIGLNLMAMLGVTPTKSPSKAVEKKTPGFDYEFFATRPGSPEKYKEITQNLKLLLKVQA
jgi:hypothetical protein